MLAGTAPATAIDWLVALANPCADAVSLKSLPALPMERLENCAMPCTAAEVVGPLNEAVTPAGGVSPSAMLFVALVTVFPNVSTTATLASNPAPALTLDGDVLNSSPVAVPGVTISVN